MARKSYEELVQLKQEGRIGWLEFVRQGDSAEDFAQWCKEHNVEQTEEYAERSDFGKSRKERCSHV